MGKYNHFSFLLFIILISVILYLYLVFNNFNKKFSGEIHKLNAISLKFKSDLESLKSQNTNLLNEINHKNQFLSPIPEMFAESDDDDDDDDDNDDKLKSILDQIPEDPDDKPDNNDDKPNNDDDKHDPEIIESVSSLNDTEKIDNEGGGISPSATDSKLTQLKNEKLETLKDICKNLKISNKGTKDALAQRIFDKQSHD